MTKKKVRKFVKPLAYKPEECPVCEAYREQRIASHCPKHSIPKRKETGNEKEGRVL